MNLTKRLFQVIFAVFLVYIIPACANPETKSSAEPKIADSKTEKTESETVGPDIEENELFLKPSGASKTAKLPLIVFLHQAGGCPAYLHKAFNRISDQWNICVYLPCGGTKLKADENGFERYDWRSKDASNLVAKVKQQIKVNNVDPTLVFLSGFSAGGSMCYITGVEAPDLWAGVIPFSGPFPGRYMNKEKFEAAKGKYPTYVVNGNYDEIISVKKIRMDVSLLNKRGFKTELHLCDAGHEFPSNWADVLSSALEWCNQN